MNNQIITELILVFVLMSFISSLLQIKSKSSNLYCGLMGFAPNNGKLANLLYLKIIASYNTIRGTDSCGFYINGKVFKGIDGESDIRVYMANNKIEQFPAARTKTIIGHTRKATYGKHTYEFAHPFEIKGEDGSTLFLAHNGTVTNPLSLGSRYGVEFNNTKIDSQLLGEIFQKQKMKNVEGKRQDFSALENYEGGTALLFAYSNEPNVLYAYKGASKDKYTDKEMREERPLYFIRMPEGIYLSSLREPLDCIVNGNKDIPVRTILPNIVVKFQNNELEIVQTIDRTHINNTSPVVHHHTPSRNARIGQQTLPILNTEMLYDVDITHNLEIYEETITNASSTSNVCYGVLYFMAGRYCTLNDKLGEVYPTSAKLGNMQEHYLNGTMDIVSFKHAAPRVVPEGTSLSSTYGEVKNCLFYEGVLISPNKVKDFIKKNQKSRLDKLTNMAEKVKQLSAYCDYPITYPVDVVLKNNFKNVFFYYKGNIYRGHDEFVPTFSYRAYTFYDGDLLNIATKAIYDYIKEVPKIHALPAGKPSAQVGEVGSAMGIRNDQIITHRCDVDIYLYRDIANRDMEEITVLREQKNSIDSSETYYLRTDDVEWNISGLDIINHTFKRVFEGLEGSEKVLEEMDKRYYLNYPSFIEQQTRNAKDYTRGIIAYFKDRLDIDWETEVKDTVEDLYYEYVTDMWEMKEGIVNNEVVDKEEEQLTLDELLQDNMLSMKQAIGNENFGNHRHD